MRRIMTMMSKLLVIPRLLSQSMTILAVHAAFSTLNREP